MYTALQFINTSGYVYANNLLLNLLIMVEDYGGRLMESSYGTSGSVQSSTFIIASGISLPLAQNGVASALVFSLPIQAGYFTRPSSSVCLA